MVKLPQNGVRVESGLDLDDQTGPVMTVGQVDRPGDAVQLLVLDPVGDAFQHLLRADHERKFGDHDGLLAGGHVFNVSGRPGAERSAPTLISLFDPLPTHDDASAGQVGTGDVMHEVVGRGVGVGHQVFGPGDHFGQVVGDHVGGHADGDAGGPVDQQVGDGRRQDGGLLQLVVIVGGEIHGLFVDGLVHAQGGRG